MRYAAVVFSLFAALTPIHAQQAPLSTTSAVLERYKQALGGAGVIAKVQSETVRGVFDGTGMKSPATFVYYAKLFKNLIRVTHADGS